MQIEFLEQLKAWFDAYTQTFLTGDAKIDGPLVLKIEHTARVGDNIRQLARGLALGTEQVHLAEAIALFHDLGRFEQYRDYRTFNDSRSVNHAQKSVAVLDVENILAPLPETEQAIIIDAVRFHNAPSLPDRSASGSMVFMRLIRDADKLDIWKVFADCYRRDTPPNATIVQHLIDRPSWEPKIVEAILNRRTASFKDMISLNDFKLLQLSWVFGLYFQETAAMARERGDLAAIAGTLPADDAVQRAVSTVMGELYTAAR